jgi:hypothetical protein
MIQVTEKVARELLEWADNILEKSAKPIMG